MGCLLVLLAAFAPRLIVVFAWIARPVYFSRRERVSGDVGDRGHLRRRLEHARRVRLVSITCVVDAEQVFAAPELLETLIFLTRSRLLI